MAAPRLTAAQKRKMAETLLADFANRNAELRKLTTIVAGLKEQVKELAPGTYGEWQRSNGTPREVLDQQAVKAKYLELGLTLPMKTTDAPVVVSPVTGK